MSDNNSVAALMAEVECSKGNEDINNKETLRKVPKTDSEDEADALVIRPKVSQPTNSKKKPLAFSLNKQSSAPLKHIKLKKLTKDKPASSIKAAPKIDPIRATVDSIEAEKRGFKNFTSNTATLTGLLDKNKEPFPKKTSEDRKESKNRDRRIRSKSPTDRHSRSHSFSKKSIRKSQTPEKGTSASAEKKRKAQSPVERVDDNSRRSKIRTEGAQTNANKPEDLVASRLSEIEATIDILKSNRKPLFQLLALPRDGSSRKQPIAYSQKIVHFTSVTPTLTWAPNPKFLDEPYYMSRDFYLAHANADQQALYRAIAESNHLKFEDHSGVSNNTRWYPKDDYLLSEGKEMLGVLTGDAQAGKRVAGKGRVKRISLVDYDSADEKRESRKEEREGKKKSKDSLNSSALRVEGNSVKVKSKWDSDYEESVSDQERRNTLMEVDKPPAKQIEEVNEAEQAVVSQTQKNTEEPKQLVSEYEEFLKLVGTDSSQSKKSIQPLPTRGATVSDTIPATPPPAATKNNWDDESSPDNQKKPSVVISKAVGKKGNNVSVKVQQRRKKKDKKKKKVVSNSDSSTESSDSSSSSDGKKAKSKRKKKKKRSKKVKVESESSSSESEVEEEKTKKKKTKKKIKDSSEKVLQDLQMKKIAIAKKLSELDSISIKKSKRAIAKDLKMLEEQISIPCISEGPATKKAKDKKEKKKKKKQSSSSEDESDVSSKHKKSKKMKRKKKAKKKETSSESSSDSDEEIVVKKKKKKKNTGKKDNKEKNKKDQKIKPELINPVEAKQEWRKRPAEDDITPIARSRPRLEEVDYSGWEDDDSKLKPSVDRIKNDALPAAIREADTEPSKSSAANDNVLSLTNSDTSVVADEAVVVEKTSNRRNSDWEANSESEQGIDAWKVTQQKSRELSHVTPETGGTKEVRAFEAIALSLPQIVSKPAEPVLDLYSPGASDSDVSSSGIASPTAIADPVFSEDSPSFSMSISSSVDKPAAVPPVVSSEPIDAFVSSSTGCTISQDDVYDPLAVDSDASEDSRPATPSLTIGLDDIPLPDLPSIADILLPGENPTLRQPVMSPRASAKEKATPLPVPILTEGLSPAKGKLPSEKKISGFTKMDEETISSKSVNDPGEKMNRWDKTNSDNLNRPEEVSTSDNSGSFETIPLLIPKLAPISLSNLPLPKVTKITAPSFSSTGTKVQLNTHITMKTQSRLPLKVASVFQSDSDEEFTSSNIGTTEKLQEKDFQREINANVDVTDFPARNADVRDWEETTFNDSERVSSFKLEDNQLKDNFSLAHGESDKDRVDKKGENEKDRDRYDNKNERSKRDDNRRRSNSPRKRDTRWTPERSTRKRSRSPDRRYRRRSRSVDKKDRRRRRTPSPRRRPRSPSPKKRPRPSSPRRQRPRTKSRSYSPKNRDKHPPRRSRSRSPVRRAVSPAKRSPVRRAASPSRRSPIRRSPSPRKRSPLRRSLSPRKRSPVRRSISPRKRSPIRRSLSPRKRSPVRRSVSPRKRSPSRRSLTPRKRSPLRRPVSPGMRSPVRRAASPVRRSPIRRRTPSPHHRSHSIPVIGHAAEVNPPLPSTPFPESEEKMSYPMSVDARIMHEFGVKLEMSPPPPPLPAAVPTSAPAPVHLQTEPPPFYYPSPPPYQGLPMPPYSTPQGGIVQVGNIMEVVPHAHAHAPPPPPPPPPPPKQQILQVGNMLQIVPTTRATAVVAPTPIASEPGPAVYSAVLQNPLIKAILAEREKIKKEKEARRAEREARRRARQAKREAKLMSVTEKLKKVERNEGLVLGQEVDEDEELLLEAMEPPSPPSPVEVVTSGDLPPAGKSILVTPTFTQANEKSKKNVIFADGLKPGDVSDCEEKTEALPKTLPKEKRFKKKVKKKVKVRIIRQVIQSDEEEDDLPPPSPPPGDPPPIFYVTFPFGEQVQYPVCQTSITTTTTKTTTLHIPAPLPQ